ncbi:hypothetical protein GSI_13088 [Ganoderma sinense ZZ0214-1]|uniref:Uncharacterized protein n=1 Tax=Ganoderma sinense ZZ0214-1 TaxID=1077348 RepID=A0A2G8RUM5_9APHY|nr:hypothetical protein GSI_13088 [Ganoderma sinense ZZ0214-1]
MDNIYATQEIESRLSNDWRTSNLAQEAGEAARLAKQHAKFADARKFVLHDIDVSLQAILDLKTRLNTLTAVGRLSDELIAKLLITFVDELYYSQSALRDYACFRRHKPPRWLKLTHVCRRWRNIALRTTRLWSHVYLSRSDAFAVFVERSKATPLDIDVRDANFYGSIRGGVSILDLIPPVSSRIRFLSVDGQITTVQAFCRKLTQPLDQLEKLVLASHLPWFGLSGPPPAVPFVAGEGLTPRLSHLELDRIPFRWTDPAFGSSLTTLKVISPAWSPTFWDPNQPDIGTTADLLDVLERIAPRLKALYLDGSIPTPDNQNLRPLCAARSLSFPSLRSLYLSGPTYDCADLLSHFSMNQEAGIHLIGTGNKGMEDLVRMFCAHLTRRPLFAVRWGSSWGSYNIDIYGWQTTDTSEDWDHAPVRLAFSQIYGDGEEDYMQTFIREISPLFSHVESLNVYNGIFYKLIWSDLFSLMPRLRTLVFDTDPPFDLFDALLDVHTLPSGQSLVPLPELRSVHFNEVTLRYLRPGDDKAEEPVFIDDLLTWVALRVQHGVPLETLELRNCQHSEEKDFEGLRRIVPNVIWDGSGMSLRPM